jgi:hypothetical protein
MLMKDRVSTPLAPASAVRISFDRDPKAATLTMLNESGRQSADVPMTKDLGFKVATIPGVYIYVIAGQWPEGHVDHVFKVSVTQ